MGFDDALNKAKGAAADHPDQVDKGVDTASGKVQEHTSDQVDGQVDKAADAAKGALGNDK